MSSNILQTPIAYLKGVGPNRAEKLRAELGIATYQDLIHLFPNRYLDKTQYYTISQLQRSSADVQIAGKIINIRTIEKKRGSHLVAQFTDATREMDLVWFRCQKGIGESLKLNTPYDIFGTANWINGSFPMPHPEQE